MGRARTIVHCVRTIRVARAEGPPRNRPDFRRRPESFHAGSAARARETTNSAPLSSNAACTCAASRRSPGRSWRQDTKSANHTDTHPRLWFKSSQVRFRRTRSAHRTAIAEITGSTTLCSALRTESAGLVSEKRSGGSDCMHVMWTTIGQDWKLSRQQVAERLD